MYIPQKKKKCIYICIIDTSGVYKKYLGGLIKISLNLLEKHCRMRGSKGEKRHVIYA